ncbi:(S)-ureidoglycine aminohydrolase [Roseovarius spongiae]|uniref:(S)-ureidoglycine aminohydrolase n=1 Tax=Roseovarius spongiae TaxID=2320272 RepID=A0A3A8AVC0_9RHOB|nr:bifunctional allantoicase/(S)-ureidoglycine aminohydrolase [Roseovarius spongiae]RKF14133.1 (S)-ureidoglycine aminohydrolase [Roseovarius spongiae]
MSERTYFASPGGQPPQTALFSDRAVFTEAYAVLPRGTMRDITASRLPHWDATRLWVMARPLSGFAETFSHYLMEISPDGGSTRPEPDARAEGALFVTGGAVELTINGQAHVLRAGGFAYIPPGSDWRLAQTGDGVAVLHWVRKAYVPADGLPAPDPVITSDAENEPFAMPDSDGRWATTRFVDPDDMRHDMHMTIVTLHPGAVIPFLETHVMEHGLYVLEGKAAYRLNRDWVEVEAGDYMWLRAFCPQACYAGGPGPFRYLLYKDVNRHAAL